MIFSHFNHCFKRNKRHFLGALLSAKPIRRAWRRLLAYANTPALSCARCVWIILCCEIFAISACTYTESPTHSEAQPNFIADRCQDQEFPAIPHSSVPVPEFRPPESPPINVSHIRQAFSHSAALGAAHGAAVRLANTLLPKNCRQTAEGYWIGAKPTCSELNELYIHGVRAVLTASSVNYAEMRSLTSCMNTLGITHINIPFGGKFPDPNRFAPQLSSFASKQIYIHCEHGADRSGAILAFFLITKHGWSVPRALLAVAFPSPGDTRKLINILIQRGYDVSQQDIDDVLGIYSGESNEGSGGLKIRSAGYVKLVNTLIDTVTHLSLSQNTADTNHRKHRSLENMI